MTDQGRDRENDGPQATPKPMTVVLTTWPEVAHEAITRLRARGIRAEVLDPFSPTTRYTSHGTLRVRVIVPEDDAERAGDVLRDWHARQTLEATELGDAVWRHLILALGPPALFVAAVWLHLGTLPDWAVNTGVALLVGMVVVLGILQRVRLRERGPRVDDEPPTSE